MADKLDPDRIIYNCHIHVMTRDHSPRHILKLLFATDRWQKWLGPTLAAWLGMTLSELAQFPWFLGLFKYIATWLARNTDNDIWEREAVILDTGNKSSQVEVFREIRCQYPTGTRFVALPMDMTYAKLGAIKYSIDHQHCELLKLAQSSEGCIIPFYAVDPRRPKLMEDVRRNVMCGRFQGVKLYPSLGYPPDHCVLMDVYAYCLAEGVPIMTHCSTGGMWKFGMTEAQRRKYVQPESYWPVLDKYPELTICLAHFGGGDEWLKHLEISSACLPQEEVADPSWFKTISDMIRCGKYPNLYADISYTAFTPRYGSLYFDFYDYLKVLLTNEKLRERVLFGSDFYVVKREKLTEKEVSIALRSRLGEELYFQIANANPRRYLKPEKYPSHSA